MNTDRAIDIRKPVFLVSGLAAEAAPRNDSVFSRFNVPPQIT